MRFFSMVLATFMVAPAALAQEDVEFKPSAEFRIRYQNFRNPSGAETGPASAVGGQDYASTKARAKLGLTMRRGESLSAFVSVINSTQLGTEPGTDIAANTEIPGTFNTNDEDNTFIVSRAWGWWKATDMLSFRFGRVGLEIADGSVYAENDYEDYPVSHEGVLGLWDMDFARVSFFAFQSHEYPNTAATTEITFDPEQNHYGASLDFKNLPEILRVANLHFVQIVKDEQDPASSVGPYTTPAAVNAQRLGVTLGGDLSNFNYKTTATYVTGKERVRLGVTPSEADISQSMFDVLLGYTLPDFMGLKLWTTYHRDSGDVDANDTKRGSYDGFYYDRHAYAGLMDVVRWGNLSYWGGGASLRPLEEMEIGLGYYVFSRTQTGPSSAATNWGPSYALAGTESLIHDDLGSEADFYISNAYESGFKLGGRVGLFMPGEALKVNQRSENIMQYWLQASMAF